MGHKMKRRSFIKILVAGLVSPFLPSRSYSSEKAIPDPRKYSREPFSHMSDSFRYMAGPDESFPVITGRRVEFNSKDYGVVSFYSGHEWPSDLQRELNKRQSLALNRIKCK